MVGFGDAPLVGPGSELQLTIDGRAVAHVDVVAVAAPRQGRVGEENLFAVGALLAARAAKPATRRQYATIYRSFGDWLRNELGRPPLVADVSADAIATYGRHLEQHGGRSGGPAAPATRRIYLSMLRALARELGRAGVADDVRVPRQKAGPPETITDLDFANLLRVPDRRTRHGKRDVALLRVLRDCGLRAGELRGLLAGDLRRPRANARHFGLLVRNKGGTQREVHGPEATQVALDAWTAVHPLSRAGRLRDDEPLLVRLGRHEGSEVPAALSARGVYKVVNGAALAAGVPERLAHPHALRSYLATSLLEDGIPVHVVQDGLGHADMRTTGRYAVVRPEHRHDAVEVLDRRHQTARRQR